MGTGNVFCFCKQINLNSVFLGFSVSSFFVILIILGSKMIKTQHTLRNYRLIVIVEDNSVRPKVSRTVFRMKANAY